MKRLISALVLLTLSVGGCSDDSDDGDSTGGSSSGGTASQAGEASTNPAAGADSVNVACDPTVEGICQNETDCPFVIDGTARLTAGSCGKGCLGKEETCARDCVVEMLPMTSDCASCYADIVNCSIANCAALCIADTEAQKCRDCQEEKGCREAFNTCSGLPE